MDQYTPKDGGPATPSEDDESQPVPLANLGARLQTTYREFHDARRNIETEWLKDLRQFNGEYEPEVLQKIGTKRSRVFVGLTRTKVTSAFSRMSDLLFQRGERFFSTGPTPVPEIDPARELVIKKQAMAEVAAAGGMAYPDLIAERRNELRKAVQEEIDEDAALAAAEMEREIDDQLTEANAERHIKETILELCIFGAGAMKCGGTQVDRRKRYTKDPVTEEWSVLYEEVPKPDIQSATIFDCFPDPFCTNMEECERFFYRHRLGRAHFRDLGALEGFDQARINRIIEQNPTGTYVDTDLERERRKVAGFTSDHGSDTRYEVLEFWGSLSGSELIEVGIGQSEPEFEDMKEEDRAEVEREAKESGEKILLLDPDAEYAANVWIAAGEVLMARLSPIPDGRIPYYVPPYEKVPHQFWGVGIPRMMRDSQTTMNAAIRIFLDNLAISSGPMLEVNQDLLAAGEDPQDIYPWRVFLRQGGDPSARAVQFYQAQTNNSGLAGIIEMFRRFADETTSLPSYTHGQQTDSLNETATGASMLMTAANIALKSTLKNLDDYLLEPMIEALYAWNMEWNPKPWIKGDFRVVARGSTALVQKELQSQRLMTFLQTIAQSDALAQMANLPNLLEDIAKSMDLDPSRVTHIKEMASAVQAQPGGVPGGPVPQGPMPGPMGAPAAAPPQVA